MSATEGQRPGNYLSCSSCWIFYLIYALSTSTNRANPNYLLVYFIIIYHFIYHAIYLPIILSHYLSSHLSLSLYIYLPIHLSLTISNRQSINQYSIAADLGAGIGLVYQRILFASIGNQAHGDSKCTRGFLLAFLTF